MHNGIEEKKQESGQNTDSAEQEETADEASTASTAGIGFVSCFFLLMAMVYSVDPQRRYRSSPPDAQRADSRGRRRSRSL